MSESMAFGGAFAKKSLKMAKFSSLAPSALAVTNFVAVSCQKTWIFESVRLVSFRYSETLTVARQTECANFRCALEYIFSKTRKFSTRAYGARTTSKVPLVWASANMTCLVSTYVWYSLRASILALRSKNELWNLWRTYKIEDHISRHSLSWKFLKKHSNDFSVLKTLGENITFVR